MRLAIVNLTGGGFSGGYRKYLKNMLPRLAAHNDVDALLCVSPEGNDIAAWFKKPPVAEYCLCRALTLSHLTHIPDRKMAECLNKFSPDIIFLPIDRYIRFKSVPVVNMVRNMEPLVPNMKGDTVQEIFKKFIQRKLTYNSVRRADHTIAVSDFVKEYLTATLHVPENKVSRVYHGLTPPLTESCVRPVSVPSRWDRGFLFTCGSIRPARGLEDALEALMELKAQNLDMRLVIAGETVPGMRKYRNELERVLALRGLFDSVCWAGNLNDEEMKWCYNNCSVFVMSSRVESFGQIALEAMSQSCICISANNPCLPEIFKDAALYYPPKDSQSLAKVIKSVFSWDSSQRERMAELARYRAAEFSWDVCAERTVAELTRVIKNF